MNSGNLITGINSSHYFRIGTPALEDHIQPLYCIMGRYCCAVQCVFCILIYLYAFWCAFASICVIGQCNSFFHRFFFGNFNFQISIRYQTELIFPFADSYLIIIVSCHGNINLFTGTNQFILRQYDFGNIPCSYMFSNIGSSPIICYRNCQTIIRFGIFVTVNTYLFVNVQTRQVIEVCFCSFIHINADRTIYCIPDIFFACICPNTSQGNITSNFKFCNNILVFIIPTTKCVIHYRFGHTFYCIGFAFIHNIRFWSLIICRNVTFYHISHCALTGLGFHFKCYIDGVRRNDIFKGVCIRFFIFAFLNIFTIHLNGINDISFICCDVKCLIFTISYFHLFSSIRNSAVLPSGCCDGWVEIRIDFVGKWIPFCFPCC